MGVPVSLKLTIKASFGGKKTLKIQIFRPLFWIKNQKELVSLINLEYILGTYFLEVDARFSSKLITKASLTLIWVGFIGVLLRW